MAMMPGLVPNIRLDQTDMMSNQPEVEITPDADVPEVSQDGSVLRIDHDDGSITISLDGRSLVDSPKKSRLQWYDNLAEVIDQDELGRIANDLLRGIDSDLESRQTWIADRAAGIQLLGLTVENQNGSSDSAPVEGQSRVRHPLLLEAVLRFQANTRGEMLPADGPVKIANEGFSTPLDTDQLGKALETDFNHYLTSTATEYYPDTDRMFLMLGFGGTAFKKVYYCPLRNRPVSESVDAIDLIVNNSATDLANAKRITHRTMMRPSTLKRMQIIGHYRDIDLGDPAPQMLDDAQQAVKNQQGLATDEHDAADRDREIYECYCELDIRGFEHKHRGKPSGLQIPYRVTMDKTSMEILSIVRNYREETKALPEAMKHIVKYTYIPGFGFYDIGLYNILGNTTTAVTAGWRELLDSGMFACFPGFLYADLGGRQNTNTFRVPPGGGVPIKTNGQMKLSDAVMPLPYKEPSGALITLIDNMEQTGERLGGIGEAQVGEGKQDAPVGTTLALIEQQTKVINAVHKRTHTSQAEEFELILQCFRDHPDSFWKRNRKPAAQWDEQVFLTALDNYDLIPKADPNTSSQTQRLMKIAALIQLKQDAPNLYDPKKIHTAAINALGYSNPEQFFAPPEQQQQPSPEILKGLAEAKVAQQDSDTKRMAVTNDMQLGMAKLQKEDPQQPNNANPAEMATAHAKLIDSQTKARALGQQNPAELITAQAKLQEARNSAQEAGLASQKLHTDMASAALDAHTKSDSNRTTLLQLAQEAEQQRAELENAEAERQSKEKIELLGLAQSDLVHPEAGTSTARMVKPLAKSMIKKAKKEKGGD